MQKPFISRQPGNFWLPLAVTALLMCSLAAQAGKADLNLPIEISSDSQEMNLKENTTTFDLNVKVTQGSLSIVADHMKVSDQDKKGQEVYLAIGKPAVYKQQLDNGKPIIAQAESIRYDVATRSLILTGNAQLSQNDSTVKSDVIRYNLTTETLKAETLGGNQVRSVFNTDSKSDSNDSKNDDQRQESP